MAGRLACRARGRRASGAPLVLSAGWAPPGPENGSPCARSEARRSSGGHGAGGSGVESRGTGVKVARVEAVVKEGCCINENKISSSGKQKSSRRSDDLRDTDLYTS